MGKRVNLSELATDTTLLATIPAPNGTTPRLRQVPPASVASNPVNPREDVGDLSDLESLKTVGQLQPCVVVTRTAFTGAHPEHADAVKTAEYVIVAGSRRRLAAERFGLPALDVVIRDDLATDRLTFYGAAVSENIDRQAFTPLEEARAVEHLIEECGSGTRAGEVLGKSKGWVSQRLVLLRLSPAMKELLRSGDLPVRVAREIGKLPEGEQAAAWARISGPEPKSEDTTPAAAPARPAAPQ